MTQRVREEREELELLSKGSANLCFLTTIYLGILLLFVCIYTLAWGVVPLNTPSQQLSSPQTKLSISTTLTSWLSSFYTEVSTYETQGDFDYHRIQLSFEQLVHSSTKVPIDRFDENRDPSLYWNEIFLRLAATEKVMEAAKENKYAPGLCLKKNRKI